MPRLPKSEVRQKIRHAVVAETVALGIGSLSVGAIVKRAQISAGTIYLHFENKEDMLQQVFLEIKSEFHAIMLDAREEKTSAEMIRRMWFDMFAFVTDCPNDFLFIEYAGAAQVLTAVQAEQTLRMQGEITGMLQTAIDDNTLASLPVETVAVLLIAPAMQLARSAAMVGNPVPPATAELTFERVWLSICAPE